MKTFWLVLFLRESGFWVRSELWESSFHLPSRPRFTDCLFLSNGFGRWKPIRLSAPKKILEKVARTTLSSFTRTILAFKIKQSAYNVFYKSTWSLKFIKQFHIKALKVCSCYYLCPAEFKLSDKFHFFLLRLNSILRGDADGFMQKYEAAKCGHAPFAN